MPSKAELICVSPDYIFDFWPHARPLIKAAIDETNLSDFAEIEQQVLDGKQLLWLAWSGKIEAAATTRLINGVCEIVACSGHLRERWIQLHEQLVSYAKAEKCRAMRIIGRPGWERALDGYRREYVILERAL